MKTRTQLSNDELAAYYDNGEIYVFAYRDFATRINKSKTLADCDKLEKSWERLVNAGIFTTNEAMRLDWKIVDKRIALGQCS